jgi:threonine dehydrogenase-like Zn-dependent dehydrogenase
MLEDYRQQFPFERIVTHRYKLDDAEAAMLKSMDEDSMKVVIEP